MRFFSSYFVQLSVEKFSRSEALALDFALHFAGRMLVGRVVDNRSFRGFL